MASAPLPLFYNGLEPLSSETHATWRVRQLDAAPFLVGQHAIPITTDEFPLVQRFMPIVFSIGDDAIPLALMGLNEGVNVFVGDDGKLTENNLYVPAYVRRYPYMLARLRPDSEELSGRTQAFMNELRELDLLMEGEVTIQPEQEQPPFVYRGFQMVNEEKLAALRGDQLRKMSQSGMLPLLYAHLFSLSLMREIFGRQAQQGKMPQPQFAPVG